MLFCVSIAIERIKPREWFVHVVRFASQILVKFSVNDMVSLDGRAFSRDVLMDAAGSHRLVAAPINQGVYLSSWSHTAQLVKKLFTHSPNVSDDPPVDF